MRLLLPDAAMKRYFVLASACALASAHAQNASVTLPGMTVYSQKIANQTPVGSFAMPVSALRFEPEVDIQGRNLAEGQADVTLRGGIFENSGFRVGAVTLLDPQTGHYFAEVPIAPAMLNSPEIFTGAANALVAANANVGTISYGWRPVRSGGFASAAAGQYGSNREEIYEGAAGVAQLAGQQVSVDIGLARSESNGSISFGDHEFSRLNARVQLSSANSQTDFFAGYQEKFFGWPNLYTPFNSNESENLQTTLFALNHRTDLGNGDFVEFGAYHRRNKDDYAFNRFAPLGPVHPFQHTTWADGAAVGVRRTFEGLTWNVRGEFQRDDLKSTSLLFGTYHSRTMGKLLLVPEISWTLRSGGRATVKAGASVEDSDRTGSAVSPVFEMACEHPNSPVRRAYFSYAKTTQLPNYTALNSSPAAGLFRGNPNLGRETSQNIELGVSGSFAGWDGHAAVFFRRDDSLVDWTFRRGVTARAANPVDIDTSGFEAVARHSWTACDLVLGYTCLTKDADYRGAVVDASFYALNYARHRFTAAVVTRIGRNWEVRLDNVARVQADNLLRQVGGDETLTTTLGVIYRVPGERLELSLQADNLWNSNFQEVPGVPAARRLVSGGIAYSW